VHPRLRMVCGSGNLFIPQPVELINIPKDTKLFYLPGRNPVGFDPVTKRFEVLTAFKGKDALAVSAFLPPAYLRLQHPAYQLRAKVDLPLWAYTACGFAGGKFVVAATRVDWSRHQEARFYDCAKIKKAINLFLKHFPNNRLYRHLAHCALNYNCLNAKNLFLQRWEAGVPTSVYCNARCLGCISQQKNSSIPASHERLAFTPTAKEISEVMINHFKGGVRPIASFGQGCEGEPLLQSDNIAQGITIMRRETTRGQLHINTNGSLPARVEQLCIAGVDSFRFSLNSAKEKNYDLYFRPKNYKFCDVVASIAVAKKYKKFVSINLLTFPGVTDDSDEVKSLVHLVKITKIDMIQWRNLNIDPAYYQAHMPHHAFRPLGLLGVMKVLCKRFPRLIYGYFNPFLAH